MSKLNKAFAVLGAFTGICASAAPLTSYAVDPAGSVSGNTEVTVNVSGSIDMQLLNTSVTTVDINTNDANTTAMHTDIQVTVNGYTSYSVVVNDNDENTALVHTTSAGNTIPAGTTIAAGTSAWGIKVGDATSWTAMVPSTGTPISVLTGTGGAAPGTATVHYGVSTSANQLGGTYKDTIVYTATAN